MKKNRTLKNTTINVHKDILDIIDNFFCGENGIYPSRSQFVRLAIHEKICKDFQNVGIVQILSQKSMSELYKLKEKISNIVKKSMEDENDRK